MASSGTLMEAMHLLLWEYNDNWQKRNKKIGIGQLETERREWRYFPKNLSEEELLDPYKTVKKCFLNFIKRKLLENNLRLPVNENLGEGELIKFLIENKQEDKKDNKRDYLIWLNTLHAAQHYNEYHIILISEDHIFTDNAYFQQIKSERKIQNVNIYKNIPAFLSIYGFNSPMLTAELILKSIPIAMIEKELLKEKDAIPSYISYFYYDTEREFRLEEFRIEEINVDAFYAHKNLEENKVEIIAQIQIMVYMLFEPEQDTEALTKYLGSDDGHRRRFLETFDQAYRPVFHKEIMFLFSLGFSEEANTITDVEYLSFFPD
jgi:hypothetical protein